MLCGSDKGNINYIRERTDRLGLNQHVNIPGYVSDKELYVFYKNSLALVMPTYLGPTNIPLLEAAELGCPVLCSDLPGHRELLEDAALYFDPANAADIRRCMLAIQDAALRRQLVTAGRQRVAGSPFNLEKSLQALEAILLETLPVRKAWGVSSA